MATTAASIELQSGDPVTWERPARRKAWGAELVPAYFDHYGPKTAAITVHVRGEAVKKFVPVSQLRKGHRSFFVK